MKHYRYLLPLLFLLPSAAFAQNVDDRVDRLERDLMLMQRQLSRSGGSASGGPVSGAAASANLDAIEERMRSWQGEIERLEFQNKQLSEKLDKFMQDSEFRFQQMEKNEAAAPAPAAAAEALEVPAGPTDEELHQQSIDSESEALPAETPQSLYDKGFKLIRAGEHAKAGAVFQQFVSKYPKDKLVGNAYYWLGESYYVQRDYVHAADNFRLGFKAAPAGTKAPDNLLKLGMTLSAQKKTKEACVVLAQVKKKFPDASAPLTQKADAEIARLQCA